MVRRGHAANIRKKHDFRFEPLGRVDGHHPHRILARLHVALDRILDPRKIVEKTREGRCGAAFMRHGEAQEFVEHVACFRAEPRFHGAASAIRAEKTGIESERTAACPRPPERELGCSLCMPCVRGGLQRVEKTCGPARRERHEIVIVEPDERRFQHAGEREIVLRKQARAPGRDEIQDGDMMCEFKPVGASCLDAALFQGTDHCLEKCAPRTNKDQNITGPRRPRPQGAAVMHQFVGARIDELRDLLGNPLGNKIGRVLSIEKVERQHPVARALVGLRLGGRPELNETRQLMLQGLVRLPYVFCRNKSGLVIAMLEYLVDRGKHARRGAERKTEPNMREGLGPGQEPGLDFPPHSVEHLRRGALEGKDRLLFVPHRKEGARTVALPVPGRELSGELFENFPLGLARILRLVDQHMVDPGIELIEHPTRCGALKQG